MKEEVKEGMTEGGEGRRGWRDGRRGNEGEGGIDFRFLTPWHRNKNKKRQRRVGEKKGREEGRKEQKKERSLCVFLKGRHLPSFLLFPSSFRPCVLPRGSLSLPLPSFLYRPSALAFTQRETKKGKKAERRRGRWTERQIGRWAQKERRCSHTQINTRTTHTW